MPYKSIVVDREVHLRWELCGCGARSFELDAEGKAIVTNATGASDEAILDAARACPTLAITLIDSNGKQVVP